MNVFDFEKRAAAVPPSRQVDPARVWRPASSVRRERFMFACQWGQTPRVAAFLAEDPSLVRTRTMWNMGALYRWQRHWGLGGD